MMKNVLVVLGTRPEVIKLAPLILELKCEPRINTLVCNTGQHQEMLQSVLNSFEKFDINYNLGVMTNNQNLVNLSSLILSSFRDVLEDAKPALVIVQGDTTTSMLATLACFYSKIPVFHVEAGLRSKNKNSPWPEEVNRKITALLAEYHFAPTKQSMDNLIRENIDSKTVFQVGNTVIDAVRLVLERFKNAQPMLDSLIKRFKFLQDDKKFILVTAHRRENQGEGIQNICQALIGFAKRHPEFNIVFPVHLNPNVRRDVGAVFENQISSLANVYLIEPIDYASFLFLMKKSFLILSDSGGIQEECAALGKPLMIMRDVTERPEVLECDNICLVGTDVKKILVILENFILKEKDKYFIPESIIANPFGDGFSSRKIVRIINEFIDQKLNF